MTTAAIELVDVCKNFGTFRAVDSLSLSVREGEIFGLLGPNGSWQGSESSETRCPCRMVRTYMATCRPSPRVKGSPRIQRPSVHA
jgi:hypothetical protein